MLQVRGDSGIWHTGALVRMRFPETENDIYGDKDEIYCLVAPFAALPSIAISALSRVNIICPRVPREVSLNGQWVHRMWSDEGRGITVIELNAAGAHSLIWWGATSYDVCKTIIAGENLNFVCATKESRKATIETIEVQTIQMRLKNSMQSNSYFLTNNAGQMVAFLPRSTNEGKATRLDAVFMEFLAERTHQLK